MGLISCLELARFTSPSFYLIYGNGANANFILLLDLSLRRSEELAVKNNPKGS